MNTDTIQKIADELVLLVQNSPTVDWRANVGAIGLRLRALSARASAGEGGVDQLIARVDKVADDILDPNDDSSSWELATELYDVCADLRTVLTAAPQPAQSGASGGGEPSGQVLEVCRVVDDSYFARVEFIEPVKTGDLVYTTPASPATEDGPDSFDCPHAHAARVCGCGFCRALNSDRYAFGAPQPAAPQPQEAPVQEPSNARKPDECANGCPPQQVCDYCQIATPPAHGDGEVWLPSAHDWLESANGVASREWMAGWDAARNRLHTLNTTRPTPEAHPPHVGEVIDEMRQEQDRAHLGRFGHRVRDWADRLSTHPTPEAQEARDGDTKRLDWLDGFTCASEYRINEYFGSAGRMRYVQIADRDGTFTAEAQSLREAIDAAMELDSIDAALALPAQGEGNNG